MSEAAEPQPAASASRHPTRPGTLPCAGCGTPVDPLRAARVACFGERFKYFCSARCRQHYTPDARLTPLPLPDRRPLGSLRPEHVVAARRDDVGLEARRQQAEALAAIDGDELDQLRPVQTPSSALADPPPAPEAVVASTPAAELGSLLLTIAALGGVLGILLALAGDLPLALHARLLLVSVATGALVAQTVMGVRDPVEMHPAALLGGPVAVLLTALVATLSGNEAAPRAITLAGVVVVSVAGAVWLMQRARRVVDDERAEISHALECMANRVVGDEIIETAAGDLRPGEEIVIGPGETVPVDCTVTAGSVELYPWFGARVSDVRGEGSSLVAGASVVDGRIRAVVGWAGLDRAWLRLTMDPRRRADLLAPLARLGRLTAERGAPFAAGLAALVTFASNFNLFTIAMVAAAAQTAVASIGLAQLGALHSVRTVLAALRRGIAFRSAEALDAAGRVSMTVFAARGTLLLGEPELANIEPIGSHEPAKVLALLAGAESGAAHPVATAVVRAARNRGVRPDGVRSPNLQPGLGVTAVASNGEQLVVGSRALMLKERISVARAEAKITELEAMGRTVLLVALGGRLIGVVGLQDGLRPGARAAVQHLLDVGVEPVLLSGDARETCEAIGRTLDVDHVRPEVLPPDRGDEVRRLADGGAMVAVVGRSPIDEVALGAADVSVALDSAGSSAAEWNVQLASDDVRDAALAVRLAHQCRREARLSLVLTGAPAAAGALAVAFGVVAPAFAPLAAFAGTVAALLRVRALQE